MYLFHEDQDSYSIKPDTPEQRKVYNYVKSLATLPFQDAIDVFYQLLWHGIANSRDDVRAALQKVVAEQDFEEHGCKLINRCYYTLVNRWHLDGNRDDALAIMILWLDNMPKERGINVITRTLRDTLRAYRDSDYYQVLKKHLCLLEGWENGLPSQRRDRVFDDLFSEYFFLYEAGTQTLDIKTAADKLDEGILQKRDQKLQRYYQDLSHFYRSFAWSGQSNVLNPTQQLTHEELCEAIQIYLPKRQDSFRSQAEKFKAEVRPLQLVGECKEIIYNHVMQPVQQLSPNHEHLFSREFSKVLDEFKDNSPRTRTVEIQIFRRLLNAIARYDDTKQGEARFFKFITVAGCQLVTSVLLKIVLTCSMVRFELEKRFAYLHHKFSKASQDTMKAKQLVKAFDHMNVALALNAKHLNYFRLDSSNDWTIPFST